MESVEPGESTLEESPPMLGDGNGTTGDVAILLEITPRGVGNLDGCRGDEAAKGLGDEGVECDVETEGLG